jgi:predicted RNA methylase
MRAVIINKEYSKMGNMKGTTKSGGQKHRLDKFYTKPEIAKQLISKANFSAYNIIIEPSAGNGSFSKQIPNCIALDLDPEDISILKQNFFEYSPSLISAANPIIKKNSKILVIGNPPFGQQNSLAIRFFNHAATFADRIAFILPISFKKESVQKRLNLNFHLVHEEILEENIFTLGQEEYKVRCIYQIWDKIATKRVISSRIENTANILFSYVKKADSPNLSIQRVGGNAGKASSNWNDKSESSNYFIKFNEEINSIHYSAILGVLNSIVYDSRDFTVGPRSISKRELNSEVNKLNIKVFQ